MTFEEFFKKKKIDLTQLKTAEPVLFAEFESHYTQMGEKSFDHTKKYWFNNLRRKYHTPEEVKVEKVKIENQIAEQTINEALSEKAAAPAPPKTGFTPRFKAAVTKPAEQPAIPEVPMEEALATESEAPKPAVGFKPRFKAGVTKPADESTTSETPKEDIPVVAADVPKPAVGFKPRFKAGVTKSVEEVKPETPPAVVDGTTNNSTPEIKSEGTPATEQEAPKPAVGFKPRFKAGVTKPAEETKAETPIQNISAAAEEVSKPAVGFKPRFKAGITKPKQEDSE